MGFDPELYMDIYGIYKVPQCHIDLHGSMSSMLYCALCRQVQLELYYFTPCESSIWWGDILFVLFWGDV